MQQIEMHKLLVVDDQIGVRRLLYEAFKDEGYIVRMAGGGIEALEKIKDEQPDLILMDMKMPGMNGLEVYDEISKLYDNLIVILMTAYGELEFINEAKKLGVRECITKPFDINELRILVKDILK